MSKSKLTEDAMFRQDQMGGAEVRWRMWGQLAILRVSLGTWAQSHPV